MAAVDGSLEDLFARAQRGDAEARDRLFTSLYARLRFLVTADLGGRHRAFVDREDVVQESCYRVFNNLQAFQWKGEHALTGFLRRVISRTAQGLREKLEAQKRFPTEPPTGLDINIPDGHLLPHVQMERGEERERLQDALLELPDDLRELILLRDVELMTLAEIAGRQGRPPSTVARDHNKARARLARLLGVDGTSDA